MKKWEQSDIDALIVPNYTAAPSGKWLLFYKNIDKDIFKKQNLCGLNFSRVKCHQLDFSSSNLSGAIFKHCLLIDVSFNGADLSGSNFSECHFSNAHFHGSNLSRVNFSGSNFGFNTKLSGETNLYKAILPDVFIPFVYWKNEKYVSDYFFEFHLQNGDEGWWALRNGDGYYPTSISEVDNSQLLHIIIRHIDLFDLNKLGFPIQSADFVKYIQPFLVKNNSIGL